MKSKTIPDKDGEYVYWVTDEPDDRIYVTPTAHADARGQALVSVDNVCDMTARELADFGRWLLAVAKDREAK